MLILTAVFSWHQNISLPKIMKTVSTVNKDGTNALRTIEWDGFSFEMTAKGVADRREFVLCSRTVCLNITKQRKPVRLLKVF